jgi:hypothetical protein
MSATVTRTVPADGGFIHLVQQDPFAAAPASAQEAPLEVKPETVEEELKKLADEIERSHLFPTERVVQIQNWQSDFVQNYVPDLETPEGRDTAARGVSYLLDQTFAPVLLSYSDNGPVLDQLNGYVNRYTAIMQRWLPEETDADTFLREYIKLSNEQERRRDFRERFEVIGDVFADATAAFLEAARLVDASITQGMERPRRRIRELNVTRTAISAEIRRDLGAIHTRAAELEDRSIANTARYNDLARDLDKDQRVVKHFIARLGSL